MEKIVALLIASVGWDVLQNWTAATVCVAAALIIIELRRPA